MYKILLLLLLMSCSPKVISYEIEGQMIQENQTEVVEEKRGRDKPGKVITIATLIIIYGLIFIR